MRIKICGITNIKDAEAAVRFGADALGFIFADSPRRIGLTQARKICSGLPPFIAKVGVFVDRPKQEVIRTARFCGLDTVQLHGEETDKYCEFVRKYCKIIKAFRVKDKISVRQAEKYKNIDALLFDNYAADVYGGTGRQFSYKLLKNKRFKAPVIISGGINPANVRMVIKLLRPYAVDVSSGVEKKQGFKSHKALKEIITKVKNY